MYTGLFFFTDFRFRTSNAAVTVELTKVKFVASAMIVDMKAH